MTSAGEHHRPDLEAAILGLLAERDPGKTICPSEAARRVGGVDWRDYMEPSREAARTLAAEHRIEILQRGEIRDPGDPLRGPIRLRAAGPDR